MIGGPLDSIVSADRILGLLAEAMGQLDEAVVHFENALLFCRKGYRPELAWSLCEYAGALVRRNSLGDSEKALALFEESQEISGSLRILPLVEKVAELVTHVRLLPQKVPEYPQGLTEREVEVLRLLASGKTNVGIANELVLSTRTVERHVSNIYLKTKSRNRSEATAYAFNQGLISSS